MLNPDDRTEEAAVLGQKYAYATASLTVGLLCFLNLAGMEKAVLAIVFGVLALGRRPAPSLVRRRAWAWTGISLGVAVIILVPALLFFVIGADGLRQVIEAFARLGAAK